MSVTGKAEKEQVNHSFMQLMIVVEVIWLVRESRRLFKNVLLLIKSDRHNVALPVIPIWMHIKWMEQDCGVLIWD